MQRDLFQNRRAETPRPPQPTPAVLQAEADHARYLQGRELMERQSVLRGLLLLALVSLLISIGRAGMERVFFTGWWHRW